MVWRASVMPLDGISIDLGCYDSERDAAVAHTFASLLLPGTPNECDEDINFKDAYAMLALAEEGYGPYTRILEQVQNFLAVRVVRDPTTGLFDLI
jgi:hypothetical protein